MLIHKSICKGVSEFVSHDAGRIPLCGVFVERKGDRSACATATDGKVMCRVDWDEPDWAEYPNMAGFSALPLEGYKAIIPTADIVAMAKSAPKEQKGGHHAILQNVAIDETRTNISIPMMVTDLESPVTRSPRPIDATYPNCAKAMPEDDAATMKFMVDLDLLVHALNGIKAMTKKDRDGNTCITIRLVSPGRPLSIKAKGVDGAKIHAIVMPLVVG